jgi:hypothetical protein
MKKKETLEDVIRRALDRQLTRMQRGDTGYLHDGWTGPALASWVAPVVIASVKRHLRSLSSTKGERGKK